MTDIIAVVSLLLFFLVRARAVKPEIADSEIKHLHTLIFTRTGMGTRQQEPMENPEFRVSTILVRTSVPLDPLTKADGDNVLSIVDELAFRV